MTQQTMDYGLEEEVVAKLLLTYCKGRQPSCTDLDALLESRGFPPYTEGTSMIILSICDDILIHQTKKSQIKYKDYTIQQERDPWALKYKWNYRYFIDGERIFHAETLEEAKADIDERTA